MEHPHTDGMVMNMSARHNTETQHLPDQTLIRGAAAFRDSVLRDVHMVFSQRRDDLHNQLVQQEALVNAEYTRIMAHNRRIAQARYQQSVEEERRQSEHVRSTFAQDPLGAMNRYQIAPRNFFVPGGSLSLDRHLGPAAAASRASASQAVRDNAFRVWSPPKSQKELDPSVKPASACDQPEMNNGAGAVTIDEDRLSAKQPAQHSDTQSQFLSPQTLGEAVLETRAQAPLNIQLRHQPSTESQFSKSLAGKLITAQNKTFRQVVMDTAIQRTPHNPNLLGQPASGLLAWICGPVELSEVTDRLSQTAYASVQALVHDVERAIQETCKHNGEDHALSQAAKAMGIRLKLVLGNIPDGNKRPTPASSAAHQDRRVTPTQQGLQGSNRSAPIVLD